MRRVISVGGEEGRRRRLDLMPIGGARAGPSITLKSGATEEITDHHDAYSIDGLRPKAIVVPSDDKELAAALADAAANGLAVAPWGGGTQVDIGKWHVPASLPSAFLQGMFEGAFRRALFA